MAADSYGRGPFGSWLRDGCPCAEGQTSAATEKLAAGRTLAGLAGDAAQRVELLLARRVDKPIAAPGAAQLDVTMEGSHSWHGRPPRLKTR